MNITFRQVSKELSDTLVARAEAKLSSLSRLLHEGNDEPFVYVDIERESGATNSESLWRASINLDSSGELFNAVSTGETPNKAVEVAIKELKREVRKAKGRQKSLARRGHELLKRLRQRAPGT